MMNTTLPDRYLRNVVLAALAIGGSVGVVVGLAAFASFCPFPDDLSCDASSFLFSVLFGLALCGIPIAVATGAIGVITLVGLPAQLLSRSIAGMLLGSLVGVISAILFRMTFTDPHSGIPAALVGGSVAGTIQGALLRRNTLAIPVWIVLNSIVWCGTVAVVANFTVGYSDVFRGVEWIVGIGLGVVIGLVQQFGEIYKLRGRWWVVVNLVLAGVSWVVAVGTFGIIK
jgi:hypothetical protein